MPHKSILTDFTTDLRYALFMVDPDTNRPYYLHSSKTKPDLKRYVRERLVPLCAEKEVTVPELSIVIQKFEFNRWITL